MQVTKTKEEMINKKNTNASDFSGVDFAYAEISDAIIKQAEVLLKQIEQNIGPSLGGPEIATVPKMFNQLMQEKEPKDHGAIWEEMQTHCPGSLADLLKAKYIYEQHMHQNQEDYKKTCIEGGAALETAKVNWQFALSTFYETKENMEATLKEAIYASRKADKDFSAPSDLEAKIDQQVDYCSKALEVAKALNGYANSIDQANTLLSTAFAELLITFNKNWNLLADGELKLIAGNRKESKDFWVSMQNIYKKSRT